MNKRITGQKDKRAKGQRGQGENGQKDKRTKGLKKKGKRTKEKHYGTTKVLKFLLSVVLHLRDVYVLVFLSSTDRCLPKFQRASTSCSAQQTTEVLNKQSFPFPVPAAALPI